MLTVREIQSRTAEFFSAKGVPDAKLDADLLLAHVLGLKRLDLYLDIERPLTEAQLSQLRPLVKRRADREPLQYILGTIEFCGIPLKVDSRALIPRPEMEELIERIRQTVDTPPQRILDLGTGSGAIAIALNQAFPQAETIAVDKSAEALALAEENASVLAAENRIQFLKGSWFAPLIGAGRFDLIVSNPPYLREDEMATAAPEVVAHEPESALCAGVDGLSDLRSILKGAVQYLSQGGLLALETGIAQHAALESLAIAAGLSETRSLCDMNGRERFFMARAV